MSPKAIGALRLVARTGDPIVDALREIERARASIQLADAVPESETDVAITERREVSRVSLAG